jgi:CHAT domain-containing protein
MREERVFSDCLFKAGDFPQGDDLIGLSRAFMHAGARSGVASLYKLLDDSTLELMKGYYRSLKDPSKTGGKLK